MTDHASPKAPTIKDVAREAGVSFKTVSRVINRNPSVNPDLRKAVEAAMEALNYRPHAAARALRSQRSYSIALLTGWGAEPPATLFDRDSEESHFSEFFGELMIGCSAASRESSYHVIFDFMSYGDRVAAGRMVEGLLDNLRPDGLLLTPPLCDIGWLLDLLDRRQVRYARLLAGTEPDRGLTFNIDDHDAARTVAQLLLEAGHRRLAMITGPEDHLAASERRKGFEEAVAAQGDTQCTIVQGDFTERSGRLRGLELLRSPVPPTAIFAANDAMAAGVIGAAAELGVRVPQDLSLCGFDDTMIARVMNLTTIRQPLLHIAARATEMLIEAADAGKMPVPEQVRLDYALTRRASVTPPIPG